MIKFMKHTCRKITFLFVCLRNAVLPLVFIVTLSLPAHTAGRPSIDQLVGFFETVVFGSEYDDRLESLVVARWSDPLRISVKGHASENHIQIIRQHLAVIKKLTGIQIEKVDAPENPENLTILFLAGPEMKNVKIKGVDKNYIETIAAHQTCFFISFKKPPDTIVRGIIVVNKDRKEEVTAHCLLEEIVQNLGLPNDTNMLRPSIFSDADQLTSLSRHDEILIRTLYDPRMTEGLDRASALNVARKIITDWDQRLPLD